MEMQQPATIRASLAGTARASALVYPALALPATLLLIISALATHDPGLLVAALALLLDSIVGGALTGLLVKALRPTEQNNLGAWLAWSASFCVPLAFIWNVGTGRESWWARSPALNDVGTPIDGWVFALVCTGLLVTLLLAADTRSRENTPSVVRHRRVVSDWTAFAMAAVIGIAMLANLVTRQGLFARGTRAELREQLARLQREATRYPSHFRSQYRLGNAFARLEDCNNAIGPLQRALVLSPRDSFARNDLNWAVGCVRHAYMGARAPAGMDFAAVFGTSARYRPLVDPQRRVSDDLRYQAARTLEASKNWAGAEQEYSRLLEVWPNDAIATVRRGVMRYNMGHRDDGLADVHRALVLSDTSYWVQLSAAEVFSEAAMLDTALVEYRALAARDSANVWIWGQYGSTAYLAGKLPEARDAFDHVESVAPGAFVAFSSWREMRNAARLGVSPSQLPPIPPSTKQRLYPGGAPPSR